MIESEGKVFMAPLFSSFSFPAAALLIAVLSICVPTSARADTSSAMSSPRVLQEALATRDHLNIYSGKADMGLNISGGLFSGRASGIDPSLTNYMHEQISNDFSADRTAELEGDQRVYALLIDGSYDFNYDLGTGLPLHPYMTGGMGMAMYDHTTAPSASAVAMQGGSMVPLFRIGGGVTYRLGEQWNMSLDYKAGFSGSGLSGGNDQLFTGRGNQPVDLQVLNMGMHYQF